LNDGIYITSLEDGKQQNAEHESIVLKVDMVHDQKTGVQEERCGYESLNAGIWGSTDKPDKEGSANDTLHTGVPPHFNRTAPRTSSVRMTVVL
jgi:hypothetical protein